MLLCQGGGELVSDAISDLGVLESWLCGKRFTLAQKSGTNSCLEKEAMAITKAVLGWVREREKERMAYYYSILIES